MARKPRIPKVEYKGKKVTRGQRNILWIEEHCFVPEGALVGNPIKLQPFQKDFIKAIYDNPAGTRRAILSFGRKNGKTAASAMLLLLHLCGPEAKPNSQLFSAARSRQQAAVLFELASKMVLFSPKLQPYVQVVAGAKTLRCDPLGTVYKALSKDATTALGLSPVFTVHDELGQVRGPRDALYEALETASGAQEQPLTIVISTQAATDADLLSVLIDDAKQKADPRTVLRVYEAPIDADPFSEETIKAANPAYGVFQNPEETKAMAADAQRMPSRESAYRNLILNQRIEIQNPFISRSLWELQSGDIGDWKGKTGVYAGIDLSMTTDLSAMAFMWPNDDGVWSLDCHFWMPEHNLRERSEQDRVPYDIWVNEGWITATPGVTVDYDYIASVVDEMRQECEFSRIAFDHWNWPSFQKSLTHVGFRQQWVDDTFFRFNQSFRHISPAMATFEGMVLNGKIRHPNNPVLNWCLANATVQENSEKQRKIVKKNTTSRIDGAIAAIMAAGVLMEPEKTKKYQGSGKIMVL